MMPYIYAAMFAGNTGNKDLTDLVNLLMWIARCLVLLVFGATGIVKIMKGQEEERPEMRTEGIALVIAGAVLFSATFALAGIFK